jgi:hypothetical protein
LHLSLEWAFSQWQTTQLLKELSGWLLQLVMMSMRAAFMKHCVRATAKTFLQFM